VVEVFDFKMATYQIAQTTLRSVLGQSELDELLAHREKLNQKLQQIIDEETEPWGIKVSVVEIKDVELPATMQRAMAAQAEAERERRAKIVHAEGELQASQKLAEAGKIIGADTAASLPADADTDSYREDHYTGVPTAFGDTQRLCAKREEIVTGRRHRPA